MRRVYACFVLFFRTIQKYLEAVPCLPSAPFFRLIETFCPHKNLYLHLYQKYSKNQEAMNIKKLLPILLMALSFMACTEAEIEQPNIIWLMAEDISLDLECYGMEDVKTPTFNKLAAEGMMFTNCFVTNPICSPSRSAMMTGTHQVKINAHNHRSNRNVALPVEIKPFTQLLREAGYTCILGHHGVKGKGQKIDCNFKTEKLGIWDGVEHFGLFDKLDEFLPEDQPFFNQIQLVATHRGDWWNEVRENSKHPVDPAKVVLPPYFADHPAIRLDWAKYLDQMEFIDNEVKMILEELDSKGMADNTVVIFIGDNGRCNIYGKGYLHDAGLRIPLIIHYPKGIKAGQINTNVTSATDITATILEIAGAEIPEYMTGQSFLNGKAPRKEAYGARDLWDEIEENVRSISTKNYRYIRNDMPEVPYDAHQAYLEFYRPAVHVMRQLKEEGKLNKDQLSFFADSKPLEELYDLKSDPFELNNLAQDSEYAELLEQMRVKMAEYDKAMEPMSNIYEPEIPNSVAILEWVKKEHPEAIKEMEAGVEIGFHKYGTMYKKSLKSKK